MDYIVNCNPATGVHTHTHKVKGTEKGYTFQKINSVSSPIIMWVTLICACGELSCSLTPHPQQDRERKEDEEVVAQDKDREITYQLPSQAKQALLRES